MRELSEGTQTKLPLGFLRILVLTERVSGGQALDGDPSDPFYWERRTLEAPDPLPPREHLRGAHGELLGQRPWLVVGNQWAI